MEKPIPYGRQQISDEDIEAVGEVLRSDYLTQGPKIEEFEEAFAGYVGSDYAVAVANGTAALHLSALALGVGEGDKVITTPLTFAASANCVRYCGGEIVFADIDPETWLLDLRAVRELLESSPNGTFSGIIPVDFAGRPVNLEAFRRLADEYGLWILEDACHAPGGYFTDFDGNRQLCGNGRFADLSIFSFHPVKHIAAGEGGMITTNDRTLCETLKTLRTHGIVKGEEAYRNSPELAAGGASSGPGKEAASPGGGQETGQGEGGPGGGEGHAALGSGTNSGASGNETRSGTPSGTYPGWYMEMQSLGYNYRLTDMQSALGLSQLSRADEGLKRRRELAKRYRDAFQDKPYIRRQAGVVEGHAYHLYVVEADNRLGLYNHLRSRQIYAQIHYIPLHLMPYYRQFGWKEGDMPHTEAYYKGCISLPLYPGLTDEQQGFVIDSIEKFYAS